jgi:hypothetical protein
MAIREDCRHYSRRTVSAGEMVQRCRVEMAQEAPFACPEDCLFFEPRAIIDGGWSPGPPSS